MATSAEIIKRPVVQLIKDSAAEFAKRLPATMDATRWAMQLATAVQKNPDLLACEPGSLLLAAYEAAELGVSLNPTLQLGFLIPYNGKAQFQISWRGLVQRAYQTGCVRAFFAEVVFKNDKFERQFAPKRNLFHAPADGDRGEELGAYALVEFKDGSIDWEFCDKALIERHRKHSKQPDSLMWSKFHEEAWRKTAIRILAKRLPLSNPRMEALAEVVERDAHDDMELEPTGRLELAADSPLSTPQFAEKAAEVASARVPGGGNAAVFYQVGKEITIVYGRTQGLKDLLPKLGAKWYPEPREWRMPAARTHELLEACEEKQIPIAEVAAEKSKAPELF
ncbi:MAG: RecT protein [Candidatus Acidoferrum typicum]|nr:RecT protein [Candidatus Acidoferrum typicum]